MTATYIIGIVFRLINFGVLLWVGYELFRRYIVPYFQNQMHARLVLRKQVHAEHSILDKDIRDIERAIIGDRNEQAVLKERARAWHAAVEHVRQKNAQEYQERSAIVERMRAQQGARIEQEQLFKSVLPHALELARAALRSDFSESDMQKKYVSRIITHMKER